jgi:hypothetical protein
MKRLNSIWGCFVCLSALILTMAAAPSPAAEAPAMTVGRIFHIEGDLLRYVPETKDWVAVVPDAPFCAADTLFSGSNGLAEMLVPNGIWIRTGNSTQIQFIALDAELGDMDVASGMARFYSKGKAAIKVSSPFGYAKADPGTIFDLYVGENSLEMVAIKGTVSFVHATTANRYDVTSGAASILADPQRVSLGDGTVDPEWNRWNMDREDFWLSKNQLKGPSIDFLPADLRNEAYVLEENGSWEKVPYEGEERWFWRPTVVAADWAPFTAGRWTYWYGDQTWIPAEPFGYLTHHYGNWIYARNRWYWAPPVADVRIGLPLLNIGFFWCPGRVAWIHSGIYVGWFPLAPRETYYTHRHWGGPNTVVVNHINVTRINVTLRNHRHIDHAVVVKQHDLHGRTDYRNVRMTNISHRTIINQYRAAPVINNQVIKNYSTTRQRFNFTSKPVPEKPHHTVIARIQHNDKIIHEGQRENVSILQERLKSIPEGKISREARVEQPRATDHFVPAKDVSRPRTELKLPQRQIKGSGPGMPPVAPGQVAKPAEPATPGRSAKPEHPAGRETPARQSPPAQPSKPAERATPARPVQPEQPAPRVERTAPVPTLQPARPTPPAQPSKPAERVTPARPAQPEQPAPRVERTAPVNTPQPARPTPPAQPSKPAERATPARPAQPEQPASRVERTAPVNIPQPAQPSKPAERATPARPAQPEQPASRVERTAPVNTPQPAQPSKPAERATPARPAQPEQAPPDRTTPQPERREKKQDQR